VGSQHVPMIFNKMVLIPTIKTEKSGIYINKYLKIKPEFITLNFIEFCLEKGAHLINVY